MSRTPDRPRLFTIRGNGRMAAVSPVLLAVFALFVTGVVAQTGANPPPGDPGNIRPHTVTEAGAPLKIDRVNSLIFRQHTIKLAPDCSLDPLRVFLIDLEDAGALAEAPVRYGSSMHLLLADGYLTELSAVPCVEEVSPGWEDLPESPRVQSPPVQETTPRPEGSRAEPTGVTAGTGSISGWVTAESDGSGLEDIDVSVRYFDGFGWVEANWTTTTTGGQYIVSDLDPGQYRVLFRDFNGTYAPEYYDDAYDVADALDVYVTENVQIISIDAALSEGASISGKVLAQSDNSPLAGIGVHLLRDNSSGFSYFEANTISQGDGSYTIGGLPPGTYRVQFWDGSATYAVNYYNDVYIFGAAANIFLDLGEVQTGIDAHLELAGQISGLVLEEFTGDAIPNIDIRAHRFNGSWWDYIVSDWTDDFGEFVVERLPAGTYRVEYFDWNGQYVTQFYANAPDLDNATDVDVVAGVTTPDIGAVLSEGAYIAGTVTAASDGTPLANIDACPYLDVGFYWQGVSCSVTDVNGQYKVYGLVDGDYRIQFLDSTNAYGWKYYADAPGLGGAADVSIVNGSPVNGIDVALDLAGQIEGTVTAEADGTPASGISVYLLQHNAEVNDWWYTSGLIVTDGSGNYTIDGLPEDGFRLQFIDNDQGDFLPEYYDDAATVESGTSIDALAGTTISNVDAQLSAAGHITGTVTAENGGGPLSSIQVCSQFYNGSYWEYIGLCRYSDSEGDYVIGSLPTGDYRVEFYDWSDGYYVTEYYDNVYDIEDGLDVPVTAGITTPDIDASLADPGSIAGTVTDARYGTPLAGVDVGIWSFYGTNWNYLSSSFTDASGDYLFPNLAPNTYRLDFIEGSGLYHYEFYDNVPSVDIATDISVASGDAVTGIDATLELINPSPFFDCVSNTGSNATIAIPDDVTVNGGLSLEAGDEFALFAPDGTCAGHAIWTGASLGLTAWGDNDRTGELDGFLEGDAFEFQAWDRSTGTLYGISGVTYSFTSLGLETYKTDERYVVSAFDMTPLVTQEIPLYKGWNLISSYIEPEEPSLETLLADIEADLVLMKNGDGQVYWPAIPVNDIGSWDVRDGYQIYMSNPAVLRITGQQVDPAQTPIDLPAGWSIIAYLRDTPMPIDQALSSISSELVLVKNGRGEVFWPAYDVNQIGNMQPGRGYHLYMTGTGNLVYPSN